MKKIYQAILSVCVPMVLAASEPNVPTVCVVSTGNWAPFNMVRDGRLEGIGIDYWREVEKTLQIKTRYEIKQTWSEVLDAIRTKTCDVTVATQKTKSREKYALFTKPYADYPIVIVTRLDAGFIDDLDQISDRTIALPTNYATTEMITERYPMLRVRYVEDIDAALEAVARGEVYATVEVLPVAAYKITHRLSNLKISGKTALRFQIGMMVRADNRELLARIDRAIASISAQRRRAIYQKWVRYHDTDVAWSQKWVWWLLGASITLLTAAVFYIVRLRRYIARKDSTEHHLKKMAYIDHVTGAYSRAYVLEFFEEMWLEAEAGEGTFAIIFFDIDYMKVINDRYGHEKGDFILRKVAETVGRYLRHSDVLGRWGGDEFMIVLPDADETKAAKLAKRLEAATFDIRVAHDYTVSCSFGYAAYCKGDTQRSLFRRADKRLYKNKQEHHSKIRLQEE